MMTHSLTNEAFAALGGPDLVYVREVKAREILSGAAVETMDNYAVDPDQILFALHRADGARLAVLADRPSAYAAAIAHELIPVSVH
jgi:hypothetical protein